MYCLLYAVSFPLFIQQSSPIKHFLLEKRMYDPDIFLIPYRVFTPEEQEPATLLSLHYKHWIENTEEIFTGRRDLIPKTSNISFYHWLEDSGIRLSEQMLIDTAGFIGSLATVKWLKKNGWYLSIHVTDAAAKYGNLEIMEWCLEQHVPTDDSTCAYAADCSVSIYAYKGNTLSNLRYTLGKNPMSEIPREHRKLNVLQLLRTGDNSSITNWMSQNKVKTPWSADTCAAATPWYFDILRWAREHGCPWDNRVAERALKAEHLEILDYIWATDDDYPWPVGEGTHVGSWLTQHHRSDSLQWLYTHNLLTPDEAILYQSSLLYHMKIA
jgi:hypothetical protein